MHYAAGLLLVATSSHLLTQALQLVSIPDPIVNNTGDYSLTFSRNPTEPQNYFVQLFNANTGPWEPKFNLAFDGSLTQTFTAANSSIGFPPKWVHPSPHHAFQVIAKDDDTHFKPINLSFAVTSGPSTSSGDLLPSTSAEESSTTLTDSTSSLSSGGSESESEAVSSQSISSPVTGATTESDTSSISPPLTEASAGTAGSSPKSGSNGPNIPVPTDASNTSTPSALGSVRKNNRGLIAGAVIGSLAAAGIIASIIIILYRRSRYPTRPLSFHRDLMVRQRVPSISSQASTNFASVTVQDGYDPYRDFQNEKVPLAA